MEGCALSHRLGGSDENRVTPTMKQVSLDTSFLISFADPQRKHHSIALDYFRCCLQKRIPMNLSVIAAGEFDVGQPVSDLPLQNFRIQPFNLLHARRAASFLKYLRQQGTLSTTDVDRRPVIVNDLNILAQAQEEGITTILTEDENTLSRYVSRLAGSELCDVEVILLRDGFTPGRLDAPNQRELCFTPVHSEEIESD